MQLNINCLGDAIRFKRCLLGLTQRRLASQLGIDYTYLSKLENNAAFPSQDLLKRIEVILGFDAGELVRLAGIPSVELIDLLENAIRKNGEEVVIGKLLELQ